MSAASNLAGLFPPVDDQQWSADIPWQPIPIHTKPEADDFVLAAKKNCARYDYAYDKYIHSAYYQNILNNNRELFHYIEKNAGIPIRTLADALSFYNTIWIENLKNKS